MTIPWETLLSAYEDFAQNQSQLEGDDRSSAALFRLGVQERLDSGPIDLGAIRR